MDERLDDLVTRVELGTTVFTLLSEPRHEITFFLA